MQTYRDGDRVSVPGLYDEEEIIENCTVHILRNSITGEYSIGWWEGTVADMPKYSKRGD